MTVNHFSCSHLVVHSFLLTSTLSYDTNHPWIPKGPTDSRGPCPALNTLCNHGYVHRNGTDIPIDLIAKACEKVFSLDPHTTHFILTETKDLGVHFGVSSDGLPTLTMSDLYPHNIAEHDSSLTRRDEYFEPQAQLNGDLLAGLVGMNPASSVLTHHDISSYQSVRIIDSRKNTPGHVSHSSSDKRMTQLAVEKVFFMLLGNDTLLEKVGKVDLAEFLNHERIPKDYTPRQDRGLPLIDLATDFSAELVQKFLSDITEAVECPLEPKTDGSSASSKNVLALIMKVALVNTILVEVFHHFA